MFNMDRPPKKEIPGRHVFLSSSSSAYADVSRSRSAFKARGIRDGPPVCTQQPQLNCWAMRRPESDSHLNNHFWTGRFISRQRDFSPMLDLSLSCCCTGQLRRITLRRPQDTLQAMIWSQDTVIHSSMTMIMTLDTPRTRMSCWTLSMRSVRQWRGDIAIRSSCLCPISNSSS